MKGRRKALVVLSGCGNRDGSEIHESVCALIALDEADFEVSCVAPDAPATRTLSHITGQPMGARGMLEESARIARGAIRPLSEAGSAFDVVVLPGGMGAAANLCTYAKDGVAMTVRSDVRAVLESARDAGKPIAAMCIAPMILAACLPGVTLTLGSECQASADAVALGAVHMDCAATSAVVDPVMKVVTTPAYMLAGGPAEVLAGARSMVSRLIALLG